MNSVATRARLPIDGRRLLADLQQLRRFGASGTGVVRPALSEADVASRHWLVDRMRGAGLQAGIDGIGTVFGRSPEASRALLIGSHTDTQPEGGWLDGSMGVVYGIEVARALRDRGAPTGLGVDVASWVDEEMRFTNFLGSRSFCGLLSRDDSRELVGRDGCRLEEALRKADLIDRPINRLDPARHFGYLEAHIEQGGVLEATRNKVGVVTAIVGIRSFEVHFTGQQNHAGTTPMHLRRDAGMALVSFAARLDQEFRGIAAERTVWTIGRARFHPGTESIIPGRADLLLQFRDVDSEVLQRLENCLRSVAERQAADGPVAIEARPTARNAVPAKMDAAYQQALADAAAHIVPGKWMRMPSGAGHDAQVFSPLMPTGMLFVPSIGGISHSFDEDTAEEDLIVGCQVFADGVDSILNNQAARRR